MTETGIITIERFERWLAGYRAEPGSERLGQAFLNSALCAAMRTIHTDPTLFYERDEARALARIEAFYVGRGPDDQGRDDDPDPAV